MMTLEEIDKELTRLPASPTTAEDIEARAELVMKRFKVEAATREAIACQATLERQKSWGFPLANVPPDTHCVMFGGGRTIYAEIVNGRLVMRLTPHEVRMLSLGDEAWTLLNPELAILR